MVGLVCMRTCIRQKQMILSGTNLLFGAQSTLGVDEALLIVGP